MISATPEIRREGEAMEISRFEDLLKRRLEKIEAVLGTKAKEYAMGGDRLHNFKTAAAMGQTTPEKALWGMAMKHLVSVTDLIEGRLKNTEAMADEKIGDLINYLILLEAVLNDQRFPNPAQSSSLQMKTGG